MTTGSVSMTDIPRVTSNYTLQQRQQCGTLHEDLKWESLVFRRSKGQVIVNHWVSRRSKGQVIMFYELTIIMTTGKQCHWPPLVKVDMMLMTNRSIGLPRWTWRWLELWGEHDEDHNMRRASRWKRMIIRELQGRHSAWLLLVLDLESVKVDTRTIRELQCGHKDY